MPRNISWMLSPIVLIKRFESIIDDLVFCWNGQHFFHEGQIYDAFYPAMPEQGGQGEWLPPCPFLRGAQGARSALFELFRLF